MSHRLLLDAHIDEVGLIVTDNDGGFLKFAVLGSPDVRALPCVEVEFAGGVYGVIDFLPPHLTKNGDKKIVQPDDLFIDTGGVSVPVGTCGTFRGQYVGGDNTSPLFTAKALDNRVGCAVLLDVLQRLRGVTLPVDVSFLFSTQEEAGLRGAGVGARAASADFAVVVDVTFGHTAQDTDFESFALGKGPTIAVGPNMHRGFTQQLQEVAARHGIAYQTEVLSGSSGTNAEVIQLVRGGVRTALLSVPLRYMHSPVECVNPADLQAASDILYYLITEWGDPVRSV